MGEYETGTSAAYRGTQVRKKIRKKCKGWTGLIVKRTREREKIIFGTRASSLENRSKTDSTRE